MHYGARIGNSDEQLVAERIGTRVEAVRRTQGLTQTELAARSELSRTILSRIERGEGNPSIGTLWRISRGLQVPLGDLLEDPAPPRTRVICASEGDVMNDPSGMVGRLLHADRRDRRAELFTLELPERTTHDSPPHLAGVEEVVVITRGRVRVGPHLSAQVLEAGDAMWFASDVPHHYAALEASSLLCLMSYPPA